MPASPRSSPCSWLLDAHEYMRYFALAAMLAEQTLTYVKSKIRDVPDFPTPGILFKDITPLLADPRAFHVVLATGGTAKAAAELVTGQGGEMIGYAFVIELSFLKGRKILEPRRVESVLTY